MRVKRVLIIVLICLSSIVEAQKPQRVAYIDMNYILENVPEYASAQAQLDAKVQTWQQKLDGLSGEIEQLKTDLSNEKSLLTKELIGEREEDIAIKEEEFRRLQQAYFGPTGDLFQMRKQFVKPVQDQVYNAIQDIAAKKRYDFVFDKSSDLIMLYSNSKYDISELVLNAIVKNRKRKAVEDLKKERIAKAGVVTTPTVLEDDTEEDSNEQNLDPAEAEAAAAGADEMEAENEVKTEEQLKLEARQAKREELKARIKAQQEARAKMRDSLKRVAEEKRAAKLKEIEDRKKQREEAIENKN
ncbi:OmpH family outer membrane protein [Lutimonas saemankumensis]|uniref:OmpH family outer membrane protein n=1 Tax=Lutimonas saemankumensis TaxID=483016 RepID=UPI001CD4D1C3|nr:OmpH family outer membrane protein [Lutimonas saemankumensis]MCA0933523.1 OmpH family outer membrane protein [Lutimonas saemankumensis]